MKSTLAIMALALSGAAAEETLLPGKHLHAHNKLRSHHNHQQQQHHHHHQQQQQRNVGSALRFAMKGDDNLLPGAALKHDGARGDTSTWLPFMAKEDAERRGYRHHCSDPVQVFNGDMKSPNTSLLCTRDDAWTIIKGGFSVACLFDKDENKCKGYGKPEESDKRKYQKISENVFMEKLKYVRWRHTWHLGLHILVHIVYSLNATCCYVTMIKTNTTAPLYHTTTATAPLHHHHFTAVSNSALEDGYFDPAKMSNALIEDGKYYAMYAPDGSKDKRNNDYRSRRIEIPAAKVAQ